MAYSPPYDTTLLHITTAPRCTPTHHGHAHVHGRQRRACCTQISSSKARITRLGTLPAPYLRCTWAGDSSFRTSAAGPKRKVQSRKSLVVSTAGRSQDSRLVQHLSPSGVDWLSKAVDEILQAWRKTGVTSSAGSTVSTVQFHLPNPDAARPLFISPALHCRLSSCGIAAIRLTSAVRQRRPWPELNDG